MPGAQELVVIAVVAMLVFGPDRLPEIARTAGKWIARFRNEAQRNITELKQAAEIEDLEREVKGLTRELRGVRNEVRVQVTGRGDDRQRQRIRPTDQPPPVDLEAT